MYELTLRNGLMAYQSHLQIVPSNETFLCQHAKSFAKLVLNAIKSSLDRLSFKK